MTSTHPVAGPGRYVDEVGRRLRDLPRDERASIEADLLEHVRDTGCATYGQCIERLGSPEQYAANLRDGMGLGEYRRPRMITGKVIAVAIVLVAALVTALVLRDEPLPDDFAPLAAGSWSSSGSDVRSAGGLLIGIGDEPGSARATIVVVNRSDRTLRIDDVGLTTVRAGESETSIGGSPTAPLEPGQIEVSSIWSPDLRLERIDDPNRTVLRDHLDSGQPFAPFEWAPGDAYQLSFDGPVAACDEIDADLADGRGGPMTVSFGVGDRTFEAVVLTYTFDARSC